MKHHRRRQSEGVLPSVVFALLIACVAFTPTAVCAQNSAARVVVLHLDDTIQPISRQYLARGLKTAATMHAEAVVIDMNTPGGLLTSMRAMVSSILTSPVPVIVFVAPSGSRAGSAGFFLLEAADVAAMAPGTNAGASHPVIEGRRLGPIMKKKLENDTTALLRSYVVRRNRNLEAAEQAVLNSKSYTDGEALQLHLIDVVSPNNRALLDALDGRTITRFNGAEVTLHTRGADMVEVPPTIREKILDHMMNPNLAVLALVIGGLLIYFEFHAPGTIIPGALGTLLVLTAIFSLDLLPINGVAVMLIIAAFALMALEMKFPSHGILAGVGIIALVLGTLTLVNGPIPELRVRLATSIASGVAFGLITVFLVSIAVRAERNKVLTGPESLLGATGVAQQRLAPHGQILVRGELWRAEAALPVDSGETVRVTAVRGLTLLVEGLPNSDADAHS